MAKNDDCRTIEKRIRKYVRINKLFKKGDRIAVNDELSRFIVKSIIKDLPVKIIKNKKNATKVVLPWTLEDEVCLFLKNFFSSKPKYDELGVKVGKKVKLFRTIPEEDVVELAKCKGFKFSRRKKDKFTKMLDAMQVKHKETRYSLLKSIDEFLR